jgi:hypothetical protein
MRLPDLRLAKSARERPATPALEEEKNLAESTRANLPRPPAVEPDTTKAPAIAVELPASETIAASSIVEPAVIAAPPAIAEAPAAVSPIEPQVEPTAPETAVESSPQVNLAAAAEENRPQAAGTAAADVTDASPADSAEPVTPAAARRQRALERQRRQAAEPPRPRTWWTTHLPVIAVCFVIALIATIYVGRRNRASARVDSQTAMEIPELDIDFGDPADALSPASPEPAMIAVGEPAPALSKSPPLLSAKPKVELPEEKPLPVEASLPEPKPSANRGEITNEFVSSAAAEGTPAAAELTTDGVPDYPNTEPAVYRPGGRVPREARVPEYPQTSTPTLR